MVIRARTMAAPQKLPAVSRLDGRVAQPAHKATTAISTAQMHHDSPVTGSGERTTSINPLSTRMKVATPAARLTPMRKLKTSHRRRNGRLETA